MTPNATAPRRALDSGTSRKPKAETVILVDVDLVRREASGREQSAGGRQ